jgi:hypothetical protein
LNKLFQETANAEDRSQVESEVFSLLQHHRVVTSGTQEILPLESLDWGRRPRDSIYFTVRIPTVSSHESFGHSRDDSDKELNRVLHLVCQSTSWDINKGHFLQHSKSDRSG